MKILVTGGAGYIGSHTCVELLNAASLAKKELNWEAKFGIEEMCADSWNWQSKNPNGYNE